MSHPDIRPGTADFAAALFPTERRPEVRGTSLEGGGPCATWSRRASRRRDGQLFLTFSTWTGQQGIHLEDLFVEPQHRGSGLGKALLVHLAQIATVRGYRRLEWTVLRWNEPAIAFYESLAATPQAEWETARRGRAVAGGHADAYGGVMTRQKTVSDSVVIDVDPQTAYAAVSDITQMGRWSPENLGGTVDGGVEGSPDDSLTVGTSFVGANRRGKAEWVTQCTVTAADPGERFAFRVHRIGLRTPKANAKIATWDYRFEAADGGTRVTETWTDDRPWPDVVATVFDKAVTGGHTFAQFQTRNIRRTLDRLKGELEGGRRTVDDPG